MNINSISELENFPFESHSNFLNSYYNNEIKLSVDRGVARQWAMYSKNSPGLLRILTLILTFSPYIISIIAIALLILTKNWLWLIPIPIIFFEVDLLNPGSAIKYGIKQFLAKIIIIVLVIVSLILLNIGLMIISISFLFQWLCVIFIYSGTVSYLLQKGIRKESTVIQLWQGNALHISTKDGRRFTKNYYEINGELKKYNEN
jgi:hypothetical protein